MEKQKNLGILQTEEMVLNMGPQHPSTHGVLRLKIHTDGEVVSKIEPVIGYLHRCFEKHCENVSYEQVVPYCDRTDYLASIHMTHAYCLAMERMLGIDELPLRTEFIRIIVAELQRIASHLVAVGTFGLDVGGITPFTWTVRDRERVLDLLEIISGGRLLYNFHAIGGVLYDLPENFMGYLKDFLDYFEPQIDEYNQVLTENKIFIERTADVGVMPAAVAIDYGVSGPNLRASGVKWDLRKDEPYSIYDRFDFDVCIGEGAKGTLGDTWDRYYMRILEIKESIKILRQALENYPDDGSDIHAARPKRVKPKAGAIYSRYESARGDLGFYIIADGKKAQPARVKMRPPAFNNLSVLSEISEGWMMSDVIAILGSLDIVLGEIDR